MPPKCPALRSTCFFPLIRHRDVVRKPLHDPEDDASNGDKSTFDHQQGKHLAYAQLQPYDPRTLYILQKLVKFYDGEEEDLEESGKFDEDKSTFCPGDAFYKDNDTPLKMALAFVNG